jgi:hypothetical protein
LDAQGVVWVAWTAHGYSVKFWAVQ